MSLLVWNYRGTGRPGYHPGALKLSVWIMIVTALFNPPSPPPVSLRAWSRFTVPDPGGFTIRLRLEPCSIGLIMGHFGHEKVSSVPSSGVAKAKSNFCSHGVLLRLLLRFKLVLGSNEFGVIHTKFDACSLRFCVHISTGCYCLLEDYLIEKLEWLKVWCSLITVVAYDLMQRSCVCLGWVWYQDGFDIMLQGEGFSGNPEIPAFLVD